jgi:hypothetical protein
VYDKSELWCDGVDDLYEAPSASEAPATDIRWADLNEQPTTSSRRFRCARRLHRTA